MVKRFLYIVLLCMGLVSSCSEDKEEIFDSNPLVVEAYLHVNRRFEIAVSNLAGTAATDVDYLNVSITSDMGTVILNPVGAGVYASDNDNIVQENSGDYLLNITGYSREISSLTIVPAKPAGFQLSKTEMAIEPIDFTNGFPSFSNESVELTWNNPSNEYYFTFFQNIEENPELINSELDTLDGNAPSRFFRGEPTQGSSGTIRSRQFQYYGKYHVILFHVNPDYAALYKEQENSSSLNLTSPFTNVVNGLGIFTAINSDTILFTVKKP